MSTPHTTALRIAIEPVPRSQAGPRQRARRWSALAPVLPALVTLALGLFWIDRRQVWFDEAITWWAATMPLHDLARLVQGVDGVLAPYYLFMQGWTAALGTSPTALRLPSALAMAGAAGLIVVLGRRLVNAPVGLVAGLLFAVLPSVSAYGQEARPYALLVAACLLSTWVLVTAEEGRSRWRWLGYGATVILVGYLQLIGLLLVLAHAGYVVAMRRRPGNQNPIGRWAAAAGGALALVTPLVLLGVSQRGQIGWILPPGPGTLVTFPASLFGSAAAGAAIVGLALLGTRLREPHVILLGVWAVAPPLLLVAVSLTLYPIFHPRYVLFTVPAWCLLAAMVVSRGQRMLRGTARWPWSDLSFAGRAAAVVALVLALSAFEHRDLRDPVPAGLPDYRGAALAIGAAAQPGDGVLYSSQAAGEGARSVLAYYLPEPGRPRDVFAAVPGEQVGRLKPVECADLASCLGETPRLWLVNDHEGALQQPLFGLSPEKVALLQPYAVAQLHEFDQVIVVLLVR